jgi:hypothetical protein
MTSHSGAHNGDGPIARVKLALMRLGTDAAGESTDHGEPLRGELARYALAGVTGVARAHNGDASGIGRGGRFRARRNRAAGPQVNRIVGINPADELRADGGQLAQLLLQRLKVLELNNIARRCAWNAARRERRFASRSNLLRRAQSFEQDPANSRTDSSSATGAIPL